MSSVARYTRLMRVLHFLERGKMKDTLAVSCGVERNGYASTHEIYGFSSQVDNKIMAYENASTLLKGVVSGAVITEMVETE